MLKDGSMIVLKGIAHVEAMFSRRTVAANAKGLPRSGRH